MYVEPADPSTILGFIWGINCKIEEMIPCSWLAEVFSEILAWWCCGQSLLALPRWLEKKVTYLHHLTYFKPADQSTILGFIWGINCKVEEMIPGSWLAEVFSDLLARWCRGQSLLALPIKCTYSATLVCIKGDGSVPRRWHIFLTDWWLLPTPPTWPISKVD